MPPHQPSSKTKPTPSAPKRPSASRRTAHGQNHEPAPPTPTLVAEPSPLGALVAAYRSELLGLLFLALGAWGFSSLFSSTQGWLVRIAGWTSPLVALTLVVLGLVLLLGRRAGYWSAESLIGSELLLLCLQAATFALNNSSVSWQVRGVGLDGGLIGWALGSLLVALLGQWVTVALLMMLGVLAGVMLIRYTPLIYLGAAAMRSFPTLALFGQRLLALLPPMQPAENSEATIVRSAPPSANFVTPAPMTALADHALDSEDDWDMVAPLPSATPKQRRANPLQSAARPQPEDERRETTRKDEKSLTRSTPVKMLRSAAELPGIDLLNSDSGVYTGADVTALQQLIEATLEDFNVPVRVVHVETGPTVTQFGVEPLYTERAGQKRKVRVSRIVNLADDLALALAAQAVRIEAPVPGRPYVGIEVPNPDKTLVSLRGIIDSPEMRKHGGVLALPLGRNTSGQPVLMDLTRAPHLLIAGATGSGKSVSINAVITGLLMRHGPETLRLVMIDPKRVELPGYNGIPHLLGKVITEMDQVMGVLTWLLLQMDDRYRLFREAGVRNIDAYNQLAQKPAKGAAQVELLPYIVLIVDELADLMMTAAEDVERQICRLAQMARATGIHLVLATQRPSVDVVTGLIKANFPTRIAFAVTSQIDSRVILDTPGAERLLGRGDMLLMRPDQAKLLRVQGCLVTDDEINRVVGYWKQHAPEGGPPVVDPWAALLDREEDDDELVQDAIDALRGMRSCSTSMLQRKLRIGFPRAARLIELLETKGVVGPDLGGGQGREVLIKAEKDEEEL